MASCQTKTWVHVVRLGVNGVLMRTDGWTMKLNGRLEARSRVDVRGRCTEGLTGQAECGTIHKLCGSAVNVFLNDGTGAKEPRAVSGSSWSGQVALLEKP